MKRRFASALLCGVALFCGCSDSEIHADKVRAALQGLPPDQMARLDEGLGDIASKNYTAAIKPLRLIAMGAKLNKDQSKVLEDTLEKVRLKAGQTK